MLPWTHQIYAVIVLQEAGRRAFWSVNGPRIVQVGYEDEEDPKVMEAYEQLGSLVNTYVLSLLSAWTSSASSFCEFITSAISILMFVSIYCSVDSQRWGGGTIRWDHKVVTFYSIDPTVSPWEPCTSCQGHSKSKNFLLDVRITLFRNVNHVVDNRSNLLYT